MLPVVAGASPRVTVRVSVASFSVSSAAVMLILPVSVVRSAGVASLASLAMASGLAVAL